MIVNVFERKVDVDNSLVSLYENNVQPFNEKIAIYLAKTSGMTADNTIDDIKRGIEEGIEEEVEAMGLAAGVIEQYLGE